MALTSWTLVEVPRRMGLGLGELSHEQVRDAAVAGSGVGAGDLLGENRISLCRCRGLQAAVTLPLGTSKTANRVEGSLTR